jgi:hypothetical protein
MNSVKTSCEGLEGVGAIVRLLVALAICLCSGTALAAGASPESATAAQKQQATERFQAGSTAFQAGRFEEARSAFEASYGTVASPNSHLMLARTLVKLGRLGEAHAQLESTVQEAEAAAAHDPKYREAGETAKTELAELNTKVGMVEVRTSPAQASAKLRLEGRELDVAAASRPIAVTPGKVTVELVNGATSEQRVVDVTAGGSAVADFAGPAAPPAAQPAATSTEQTASGEVSSKSVNKRTLAYIAGGVGVAGLVTFAIFGAMNNSKFSDLEDQCKDKVCPTKLEDDADTGQTYQTIANVGLFVGVIGLATGGALFYLSTKDKAPEASARRSTTPRLGLGPGSITLSGRF